MRSQPPPETRPVGIYLHFPFCAIRCTYCDFPTVAGRDELVEAYLAALAREIRTFQRGLPRAVDSVFLGGGTPSRMSPVQVAGILDVVRERFDLASDTEITLEANPESLSRSRLVGYRDAGVNRLSIGVQSLDDRVLAAVGRAHDAGSAVGAVAEARQAGFSNVNLDLIAGLPGEDLSGWSRTMERAASLEPDHVSVYLLETDKDTPLARALRHGRTRVPDDDQQAEAYERTVAVLECWGYEQYVISNFARGARRSRHNRKYWTDAPYGGFGLGAHAYFRGARRANRRDLDGYLGDLGAGRDPVWWTDPWNPRRRLEEALVLGLRLAEGVDLLGLGERYGVDLGRMYQDTWQRGLEAGLLQRSGSRLWLTPCGRLRSNELFSELIGDS